jgi:NADH-quinone oxidoreductase subunit F
MVLSAAAHDQIREEIGHYPNPRGALLYALHVARDETGRLDREIFAELGEHFGMSAGEVAEVASFYSLFNQPRAQAIVQVCTGLPCCLKGARGIVREAEKLTGAKSGTVSADGRFAVVEVECLGSCGTAPVVQINRNPYIERVTPDSLVTLLASPSAALEARPPAPLVSQIPDGVEAYLLPPNGERRLTIDEYKRAGGYQAVVKAGAMEPKDIAAMVKDAGLRGRGGAGFATGLKWTFMPPPDGGPRYLAVNCDESEPGTFKDRQIMERNPHLVLEGVMIASMAIQASAAFMYIRGEYVVAYRIMREAIRDAYAAGILGENALGFNRRFDIHIQPGAGAYICAKEVRVVREQDLDRPEVEAW